VLSRSGDAVGVCQTCGALACRRDGERDRAGSDFVCGMCDASRLMLSAGLPPRGPSSRGGGGSGGVTQRGPSWTPSGGGGAAASVYVSGADFEDRRPTIAQESAEHRVIFATASAT
jgi:hypothetical protein